MVEYSSDSLDMAFQALSDPTRRHILGRIAQKECTVSELAEPFDLTFAAVSKHLQVLERAQLVAKVRDGRTVRCRATLEPLNSMKGVLEELSQYWIAQLDALEKFLTETGDKNERRSERKSGGSKGSARKKGKSL